MPIQSVQIDDAFWSPKIATWRTVTITDCLDKFEQGGALENFDHVARGELKAEHKQLPWFDGLIYEMIQASADFIAEHPDAKLEARCDAMIDRICAAAAADPDGYINTYTTLKEPTHRWGLNGGNDRWQHDLYNAGILVDAGVHYYRATGKTKLLSTAVKFANFMSREMGPPPRKNVIPGHAIGEEALIGLYQLFVEQPQLQNKLGVPVDAKSYLALAQFWIDARGHHEGRPDYGAYDQDHKPVLEQTTIEGHAVRAALMCSGLTVLGSATDRSDYAATALRLWHNMVGGRVYLTGAIGSNPQDEKFSEDFTLPNTGYAETCAAVANGFFSRNINLATGDATAADELERTLYNGSLSGVSLQGTEYFYENPLETSPKRIRWKWHECPCCPPMFLKLMAALPSMIYATGEHAAYVNLFVGSTAKFSLNGKPIEIKQTTNYPWDGHVELRVDADQEFDLMPRVPGWARGSITNGGLYRNDADATATIDVKVNHETVVATTNDKGYLALHRTWKRGDVVELNLPMTIHRVTADSRVAADAGRVALMRGPIVYCVESIDNDGSVGSLSLPNDATLSTESRTDLLNGVTVVRGVGQRTQADGQTSPADFTAIPYYANANRGPVSMRVWLPTSAAAATPAEPTTQPATTRPTFMPAGAPAQ